ncbi:MAG TPA: acylneuraminate cytidylyltransferase family protein [Dyadobacter sp.]|jgi:CMP-N,N'-diacetyllegionaminic acid synthase|nr:acylneuraminate cytidylyltransferase family protein [Dyadobacter sp.]
MKNTPKILAVIPARKGSKGIPGKNLKLLNGKPLIHYTFEAACDSKLIHTIILSTDCQVIAQSAEAYPAVQIPFLRPDILSGDAVPTVKVLQHVVNHYDHTAFDFDYMCLLQPTSPFRSSGLIDLTIELILTVQTDSLVTVRKVPDKYNPHWVFEDVHGHFKIATGEKELIPRRQELPNTYYRDGQVYITHVDLIRKGKILGENPAGFLNDTGPDINIDTPEDWQQAETWLRNGRS